MDYPFSLYAMLSTWGLIAFVNAYEKIRKSEWFDAKTKDKVLGGIASLIGCCLFVPELVIITLGLLGIGSMLISIVDVWRLISNKNI